MKKYINFIIVIMIGISIIAGTNTSTNAAGDTIGDVFKDEVLKACIINNAYGKGFTENTPIEDAANYYNSTLACSDVSGRVEDLTGIDRLTKINTVQLIGANIQDFTPLKNMTKLTKIDASKNGITDDVLATLEGANLPNLTILTLNNNAISDLSPIADLTSITMLNLRTNNVSDIEPLKDMVDMWDLNLGYNNVSDITPVENMSRIYRLYFAGNQVETLEPLRGTQTLGTLQFSDNKITDLSPIEENTSLFNIMADGNQISQMSPAMYDIVKDFSHFAYFNNQTVELSEVSISNNQVVIDNPIKVNGNFVTPTNISDGGSVSPDNSKITWNFSGVAPQQVTFDFSEVVNPGGDGTRTLSGSTIVPLAEYFTVSYNSNGGSAVVDEVVRKDALATAPAIPTKTDFDFEGWYKDSSLSQKWDFNTAITSDITLYAKWTPKVTTATYKVEHYQEQKDGSYKLKDTENLSDLINATVSASPKAYTGYTYDSKISGTKVSGTVASDGSLTLKLYYKANVVVNKNASYKVEHYLQQADGSVTLKDTDNLTGEIGKTVTAITKTYEGYTYDSTITGTKISGTIASDGSLTLKLYYKANVSVNETAAYKVEYYLQQPDGSYTLKDTDNFTGTIGSVVNANIKTYNGYVYTSSVNGTKTSGAIVEDGSLVLRVYYRKSPLSFIVNPSTATKDGISISQSVQTGDESNNILYLGMAGISLLIILYGVRKKKLKI